MRRPSSIEPLEARLAPALVLVNPLADIVAGAGSTIAGTSTAGTTVELGQMLDPFVENAGHTFVKFTLNLDLDPNTAGIQLDTDPNTDGVQPPTVVFELFDEDAPLTVQNFLRYAVNSTSGAQFANDYTGTFLHRIFDFGAGSDAGIDIVQGGGFSTTALNTHIPTFATLHNEYSAAHPNARGTIAMGKTAVGPNTASSEWFVNTTDNSTILGPSNGNSGGYTVFGEVAQGMEYFDKIALLQKINATSSGSALSDLPVQNYTASAGLKTDNLVTITSVEVTRPAARAGATDGQTFSVVSIINPATGLTSDAVTAPATLTGSALPLTYVAGKSGIADVTVRITQNGETIDDTFRVTVLPNLIATIPSDSLSTILVPGDLVTPKIKILNSGGGAFAGNADLNFYLSPLTSTDSSGFNRDADDILIGSFSNKALTVASDGSVTLSESFKLQGHLDKADGTYRLIGEVIPRVGASTELFTDDQVAPDGNAHAYVNQFGIITVSGAGSRVAKLSYTDDNNNLVTLSITGAGNGHVGMNSGGINISVAGTNTASIVNLATKAPTATTTPVHTDIHHIDIANSVGSVNFGLADVDGYITISSGAKTATFGDVTGNDRTLILGALGTANNIGAKLSFGHVSDLSIESNQPIATLSALEWLNTAGSKQDAISTPTLTNLNIRGNAAAAIAGNLDADVTVTRATTVSSFVVKGALRGSTVSTLGNVTTVSLGGMSDSEFLAGANAAGEFPTKRTITSFSVGNAGFTDSEVAAASMTTVAIKGVLAGSVTTTGPGTAHIGRNGGATDLSITGTDATSVVRFTTTARTAIHDLDIAETIGTFSFSKADVSGLIAAHGGVKTLSLGNVAGGDQTFHLGAFGDPNTTAATLNFGRVSELNLESDQPIAALNAVEWQNNAGTANHITAPVLTKLNIKGAVDANGVSTVSGDLEASVNLTQANAVSSFLVKGTLRDATVTALGNVGTVRLGGMVHSNFFVGVTERPDALSDFAPAVDAPTITSFTITGSAFSDSQIAARTIATIVIKAADGTSGTGSFGFVADKVNSYTRGTQAPRLNLDTAAAVDVIGHYSLTIL